MHLSSQLDCDLVAVETADELTLLVEITAPVPADSVVRPAATLQVVLDRSGSMGGDRIAGAKTALIALIDRLEPTDNVGILSFDNEVEVVVPAGPLTNKAAAKQAVSRVFARGGTDLSAGYLRGLQEARRVATEAGSTLLLISDGHANAGLTDPDQLGKIADEAAQHRVTTSTLGFGLGYDESLLGALARGGRGNEMFAENADTATALIGGEVEGLLTQVAQAASLRIRTTAAVAGITLLNDLPCVGLDDGIMIELGSLYAGETRRLVLKLSIPAITALGLAEVAQLELTHVSLPDVIQHTATLPIHVNVVPGDQAAGRLRDPKVVSEALFQQTQRQKKEAGRLLAEGHADEASAFLQASASTLRSAAASLPDMWADELVGEADVMGALAAEASFDMSRASKSMSYDSARKSRQRGRRTRGGRVQLRWAYGHEEVADSTLVLDEWQLTQLMRVAPAAAALRPDLDSVVPEAVASEIAYQLGEDHLHFSFFVTAGFHGGLTVERA